jgi:hypothetical protein
MPIFGRMLAAFKNLFYLCHPIRSKLQRNNKYNHETDISTAQQEKEKQARFSQPDGNSQRPPRVGNSQS